MANQTQIDQIFSKLNDISKAQSSQAALNGEYMAKLKAIGTEQAEQGKSIAVINSKIDRMEPAITDLEKTKQRGIAVFTTICVVAGTAGATLKDKAMHLFGIIFS